MGIGCSHHRMGRRKSSKSSANVAPFLYRDWTICCHLSRRQFFKKSAALWLFDPMINYVTDAASRFQPWVTGGRYLTPVITNSDYFELGAFVPLLTQTHGKFLLVIEKRHKEMLSWKAVKFPRPVSFEGLDEEKTGPRRAVHVIGLRDDLMVIQVCREDRGLFEGYLAKEKVDMVEVSRIISFPYRCQEGSVVMEATVSPDYSKVLLKPSWVYLQKRNRWDLPDDCVYLLDLSSDTPTNITLFPQEGRSIILAFDPRYAWSRLAVASRCLNTHRALSIMDLRHRALLVTAPETNCDNKMAAVEEIQGLTFSPDGRFLAALTGILSSDSDCSILPCSVRLHDSDSLVLLWQFAGVGCGQEVPVTPSAIFPLFSLDCRQMALMCEGRRKTSVILVSVPVCLTLRNLCRQYLRRHVDLKAVPDLPLTRDDIDYLLFHYTHD